MHIIAVFLIVRDGGGGGYLTIYRNNLENHLLLSGAGLDEYKFIAFCCWLGCILQEGCSWAEFRTSFGERLQIPLGSICRNCLCTFFGMQVQALLKSSNQVSARVCEANSLY